MWYVQDYVPNVGTKKVDRLGERICQWIKDIDGDELDDRVESSYNCQVNNPDTDGDGYKDGQEIRVGTDPIDPASK